MGGHLEGLAEVRAKGSKKERLEIAIRMKSNGMDMAIICQITELSEEKERSIEGNLSLNNQKHNPSSDYTERPHPLPT